MTLIANPIVAQRQLLAGKALVDQPELVVIAFTGEDRHNWLHSLLSQNLRNLQVGQSTEALALDANGHIQSILRITEEGERTWAIVDQTGADQLLDWLRKMVFRSKVQVLDLREEHRVVASWGAPISTAASVIAWTDSWTQPAPGGHRYGSSPAEPWALVLNVLGLPEHKALQANSATEWAPQAALDALRIAAHRPSLAEVDEKSIPHELDLLASAVHLSKGCYRGQETVAKVHNLGHPPRRLVMLHLDGSTHIHPEPGAEVVLAEDAASGSASAKGRITSVAQHHEMGPIALAVIGRMVPADQALAVLGGQEAVSASQEIIVPLDAGKVANLPRPGLLGKPRR